MWRDEVRAFSAATEARSWPDLVSILHQEAHPILWYALLRIGHEVTHSNLVLPVASLAVAAGTAFLILRFAPFPVWIRLLCIFGAFLGHEYSVVCRNYGLGVLLMIVACIAYPARHERPLLLGLALALLANTSVHAVIASVVLLFAWLTDVFRQRYAGVFRHPTAIAAVALAVIGAALAIATAHPSPDMAYAFSLDKLQPARALHAILIDPGVSLSGDRIASISAAEEIPWGQMSLDPRVMTRLIADLCILSVAWALRRNRACLVALVLATLTFAVLFRVIYVGSLRHEGILTFLMISLSWIACAELKGPGARSAAGRIALGLVPLLATQAIALPLIARRDLLYPQSSSRSFGSIIRDRASYRDAILIAEPDYLMESMPYYVGNRVFMARQRSFDNRVYFDRGVRRQQHMSLGELINVTDSITCATQSPALLSFGYPQLWRDSADTTPLAYGGAVFTWSSAERTRLFQRGKLVASFGSATTDENYYVFELLPRAGPACGTARTVAGRLGRG